mmetsp:Transcript_25213/g.62250  ORF Transcript_25213/g.62250 Transcript_25213/m.62250 type:complete len:83 (-) Transcript_25213:2048-2296(-)
MCSRVFSINTNVYYQGVSLICTHECITKCVRGGRRSRQVVARWRPEAEMMMVVESVSCNSTCCLSEAQCHQHVVFCVFSLVF